MNTINRKLDKNKSNNIKGILILLIIIGHLNLLSSELRYILYSFHVILFFLLPFLYVETTFSMKALRKLFKRLYIPFFIFYSVAFITYSLFYLNGNIDLNRYLIGLLIANTSTLDSVIGIKAYWFFPTYFLLVLLLMSYNSMNQKIKKIIFIMFFIFHFFISIFTKNELQSMPYNIYIVFYLFSLGLIFKYIYNQYNIERLNILYPLFGFLISATVIYGTNFDIAIAIFPNIMKTPLLFLSHDLLVLFAFIILIKLSGHNCIFITKLGVFSIAVYTIHPLVIQALKLLIQSNSFLSNLLIFILTIILTLLVIRLLQKLEIYQVVYPR